MHAIRTLRTLARAAIGGAIVAAALATGTALAQGTPMADGEVRRVDAANNKITLKHGEIKNLNMSPMTMVFEAKDPKMLQAVKPGDKVRFRAEQVGGVLTVTSIEAAK